MYQGEFLTRFFEARGTFDVKPNGEADVLCPFPHDKGFETRPSGNVNVNKAVYHCKTCAAEGRFQKGGMSETDFVAKLYNIPYEKALEMLQLYEDADTDSEVWKQAMVNLLDHPEAMKWLTEERGLTKETIIEHKLGYIGSGVVYPVFVNDFLLDKRTYNRNYKEDNQPKIKSDRGASNLLFPYDEWMKEFDTKPTILAAGENDTLLARQNGFNAITVTFGEGSQFPKIFLNLFKGKVVYIAYDADEAGQQGARIKAFELKDAGAIPYIVDLGSVLTGEPDDKDLTDFFLKHKKTAADFQALLDAAPMYTPEEFAEDKNKEYPLVDLWNVPHGEYSGKRISSRVIMMGKFDEVMRAPTAIEWQCNSPVMTEGSPCITCPLQHSEGWWTLKEDKLKELLYLVEVDEVKQTKAINRFIGLPPKCPGVRKNVRAKKHVQKIILAPDVETESELSGFKAVEHYAYALGLDLEDGQRYRAYMKAYEHPLQDQNVVSVVDRVEESDNAINMFKLTPEIIEELENEFSGSPVDVMKKRFENAKHVVGDFAQEQVAYSVDVIYHSVLDFKFGGRSIKGHPEGLIIGPSRTGKSDTALKLQQYYQVGNFTECKTASTAGLLGGADKMPNGAHRIRWGKIPRNHRGLLVLDELSGMPIGVMATLTGLRSQRIARIEKIVNGVAPAKTRLLWISNPRVQSEGKSLNVADYPNGVKIVLDLIGSDEDIARFDFVVILPNIESYVSPLTQEELEEKDNPAYRHLIHWVWSRTSDQVKWGTGVEQYVWQRSQELNERFDTDVKFLGAEAWKKLARIAVSCAGACFSHDGTGENILITKDHVDWAADFLIRCYDNDVFRLPEYVHQAKATTTTNPEIDAVVTGLVNSQPMIMKTLASQTEISLRQLEAVSGLDRQQFQSVFMNLVKHALVQTLGKDMIMPTRRFRKALENHRRTEPKQKLIPLSEQGGFM